MGSPAAPSMLQSLERVRAEGGGLYGSAGELFSDAVFGRDSVEAAEDLLHLRPDIALEVILALAKLQGTVDAAPGPNSNEEEVGKIHHEHRSLFVGTRRISARSQQLLEMLSAMWGGTPESLTYYGSVDATPLYIRLIGRFCAAYGSGILTHPILNKDRRLVRIEQSLRAAVDWLTHSLERSDLGLLEFCRRNPRGIPYQAWKDSGTSYLHADGSLADHTQPIASVEVQGYAHDALLAAATLLPDRAEQCRELARRLRQTLLEKFWMPRAGYFAMALDRDRDGRPRQVESISSNGVLLLASSVFDGAEDARPYVSGLVRRIYSADFVTEVGVRCRSLAEDGLVDFQDYHGTWVCWAKDGFDVAQGLAHSGFPRLAAQLHARLLNGVNVCGAATEFLYVSPDQQVHYDFADEDLRGAHPTEIHGTNRPEPLQTWTVSAMLNIKTLGRGGAGHARSEAWRRALEADLLPTLPLVRPLKTAVEREAAYARRGDFVLNPAFGVERDQAARASGNAKTASS
ncbi:MAG TPA: hypothetical protein VF160_12060 [Candidatus Dormibacteraeota bacterium]